MTFTALELLPPTWILFSLAPPIAADMRGRSALGWFFLALVISPLLAFIIVLILPNKLHVPPRVPTRFRTWKRCPHCGEMVFEESESCTYCGRAFKRGSR